MVLQNAPAAVPVAPVRTGRRRLAHFPPNWFAAVMGTGVIAVAIHALPHRPAVLDAVAVGFWLLCLLLMGGAVAGTAWLWRTSRSAAQAYHRDPVTAHFYGAVPMAVLTVGTSTLLAGAPLIGRPAAIGIDLACLLIGTVGGLLTAVLVPRRQLLAGPRGRAFAGWLMPVVPPTVSASAAALLAMELDSPAAQRALVLCGTALLILAVVLTVPVLWLVLRGLLAAGPGPAGLVPTWWIVLGPLGQSVTAACLLERAAQPLVDEATAHTVRQLALGYAVPVWSAGLVWIGCATVLTVAGLRRGLPFSLAWWSFTFPLGTFVTGSAGLAVVDGGALYAVVAVLGFGALLLIWVIVAARTGRGVWSGALLAPVTSSRPDRSPGTPGE